MSKPRFEILPPVIWQHIETMLSESKLTNDIRYSKVTIDMTVDDVIRLFIATVEDSLEYETTTLIKNNTKLSSKENIERTIIDDRLERLIGLLKSFGINNTALYCHINMVRDQYFHKLSELNAKLEEAGEVIKYEQDKQEMLDKIKKEDDEVFDL